MSQILNKFRMIRNSLSTRSGRKEILGLPIDEKSRYLRKLAVSDFRKNYSHFVILGNQLDFDGYVQYIDECGNFICELIENAGSVRNKRWDIEKHAIECGNNKIEIHYRVLSSEEIPVIIDLISESRNKLSKLIIAWRISYLIILAELFRAKHISSGTFDDIKKQALIKVFESNKENLFPINNTSQLYSSGRLTQMLFLAEGLRLLEKKSVVPSFSWGKVYADDFVKVEKLQFEELRFWYQEFIHSNNENIWHDDLMFYVNDSQWGKSNNFSL